MILLCGVGRLRGQYTVLTARRKKDKKNDKSGSEGNRFLRKNKIKFFQTLLTNNGNGFTIKVYKCWQYKRKGGDWKSNDEKTENCGMCMVNVSGGVFHVAGVYCTRTKGFHIHPRTTHCSDFQTGGKTVYGGRQ